ncbi:MAG: efflux RND transporter permease subunit, partial [Prevotella sp.]|nr:efflux RND transporter permease subunit [Prevotella sp.]
VTLAALIVTLGMIVDNSIVIIDCYIEKIDQGMSRWHAATLSAKEFFSSIFSATLAISITFFPLLITMRGMMLDFVKWFPLGVSIVLGVSLLIAVFMVPWMQYTFIKKGLKQDNSKQKHKTFLEIIQHYYNILINACFRHPFITLGFGVVTIVIGGALFANAPQKLMPRAERNQFAVEIYMPSGTAIERTAQVADSLQHLMKRDSRVLNVTTFYGSGSPRFQTSYAPQIGGTNFAQFIVNTKDDEDTQALLDKFTPMYSSYFSDAQVRIKQLDYSDAISPIEIRFSGSDLSQLHKTVDHAMAIMRRDSDLLLVRSNFEGTTSGLNVIMNSDESNRLGINKAMLSMNLATKFGNGIPLTKVWEGDYPVNVMLKDVKTGKQNPDDLSNAMVSGLVPGVNVHLSQIANVKPDWHESMIVRRNGVRTISVLADVRRGVNLNKITDRTLASLKSVSDKGVTLKVGGQRASDDENGPQIYGGLSISIVIIFLILIFHFKDIRMSVLIMFSLLFSLLGAAIGIYVMRQDVSLTGILGMISLMGIIVRNGIIMIDYAEELRKKNRISAKHAAIQAAERRMRPIFLTSAAASMGVVPMVIQNSPMWGPMGVVVCFGTIVAMFFILTMIPIGYWMIFRIEDKKRHLKNEKERAKMMLKIVSEETE